MSSYTPDTDLWLERSRLDGMLLSAVSYGKCPHSSAARPMQYKTLLSGIFFLLTLQATAALTRRPRNGGQVANHRWMLLGYVWITFVLATIGFAGNARYTEMIWIDLRDAPGGPVALILDELNYWINMMALTWYVICIVPSGYRIEVSSCIPQLLHHGMVHASFVGSYSSNAFILYTHTHLRTTASPLLRPLELAKTRRHTHVHTLCSYGRYVSSPSPSPDVPGLMSYLPSHVHSCPRPS